MNLGTFSLSLTVRDINNSIEFYQTLGFKIIDGGHLNLNFKDSDIAKWRILEHPSVKIGLFQGMFDKNVMTFHTDAIFQIQKKLSNAGVDLIKKAKNEDSSKSILFSDPDGNIIMIEQTSIV